MNETNDILEQTINHEAHLTIEPIPDEVKEKIDKECKVLIGIPHNHNAIDSDFTSCLDIMKCYIGGEWAYNSSTLRSFINSNNGWIIHKENEFPYEVARNKIVKMALLNNYTHVAMIDSDMVFHKDILYRLLMREKDIVSGVYYTRYPRKGKFMPAVFKKNGDDISQYSEIKLYNGLVEEENIFVGTGILLIKTDVFRKLKYPWFKWIFEYDLEKEEVKKQMGEDIYFCLKANEAGYKVCLDTDQIAFHKAYINLPFELNYDSSLKVKISKQF